MERQRDIKGMFLFIFVSIITLVLGVNNVFLYKQIDELKKDAVQNLTTEYDEIYRLSKIIDEYYIKNDFREANMYRLLVNRTTHNFSTLLSKDLKNLLTLAYDPLFADLSLEQDALNKREASQLITEMNNAVMLITKNIVDMKDNEKEKLLDQTSPEFIKVNTQIKNMYARYIKRVDDYFKNNK
jgi:TRAP-type mannitol/chloroaromatic compound transport system substrate-binding protein